MNRQDRIFPASKKIVVGATSSLVDLKAELFRRKAEAAAKVNEIKTTTSSGPEKWKVIAEKLEEEGKLKEIKPERKPKQKAEDVNDDVHQLDENLKKSREALERKSRIYNERFNQAFEDIQRGSSSSDDEEDEPHLVNFKKKALVEGRSSTKRSPSPIPLSDDEDWVEFTDSLGRTRKCHKSDLEHYKKLDDETKRKSSNEIPPPSSYDDNKEDNVCDDDLPERNYDVQNRESPDDEPVATGPIHYRDVQKDEVREHGVGFFAFSSDDAERKKQKELLDNLRDKTKKSREEAIKIKQKRKNQKRERLRKIAERKGIPFNEEEFKSSDSDDDFLNFKTTPVLDIFNGLSQRDREVERMKLIMSREWDVGKKDNSGRTVRAAPEEVKSKEEPKAEVRKQKMSDKDFIKERRDERDQMFAPPSFYQESRDDVPSSSSKGFNSFQTNKRLKPASTTTSSESDFQKIINEKLAFFKGST